jgi:probable O-glycosylation ligase (exosortase A-associated)
VASSVSAADLPGISAWLFGLYLVWLLLEWGGLTTMFPALRELRLTTAIAVVLFGVALGKLHRFDVLRHRQSIFLATLIVMTLLSVLWAEIQARAADSVSPHLGYFGFFIATVVAIDRRQRIDRLAIALSLVLLYLVGTNLGKLTQTTRTVGFQGGYFLGDANDFAWGLNVLAPFALYLALTPRAMLSRVLGLAAFGAAVLGIVGTQSRGGTLALAAGLAYYWFSVSKQKVLGLIAVAAVVLGVVGVAPGTYFERLKTITTYSEDNSAVSRLQVWQAGFHMALDYPLGVGAGNFASAYGRHYLPAGSENAISWGSGRWLNAHSVYFKILGEYGFPGLAMLIGILVLNLRDGHQARNAIRAANGTSYEAAMPPELWPAIINMSLIGYAVGGAFLGGYSYPHLYLLSALPLAAKAMVARAQRQAFPVPQAAQLAPAAAIALQPHVAGINPAFRMRQLTQDRRG